MRLKTLALIIPAYNEERHLKDCLDAIAAQEMQPDEVIVVDNNSTDKTKKIASGYGFVTLISEKKQGVVFARNAGFNYAKSQIIGRIDADTILPKDWVSFVKHFYVTSDHDDHAFTGGGYFYNVGFPPKFWNGWIQSQLAFRFNRFIMGHYILWGSNMALTRAQWKNVRSDLCLRTDIHEDIDLAIHMHRAGYKITYRAGMKVGVAVRRVFDNKDQLLSNMLWWPRTLRSHGIKKWIFGWLGAYALFFASPLLRPIKASRKMFR